MPRLVGDLAFSITLHLATALAQGDGPASSSLAQRLDREDPVTLAKAARELGDAVRGAFIFYQPHLACTKCHLASDQNPPIGPDLTRINPGVPDVYWIESLLEPSKTVKPGFEVVIVGTSDGTIVSGLLAQDRPDAIVLRSTAEPDRLTTIAKGQIVERKNSTQSMMPDGQVNLLGGRQEFLDLVRYVMETAEGGPERAEQLRPPASFFAAAALPDYEKNIDHAGMIQTLGASNFQRGEAIYNRLCINCHGTKDQPGSLPSSLAFASGMFKNGSDPYRMYQTLTHGFGMMTAQSWMVPEQKYDVIHYIREAYLKPFNPSQFAAVDETMLRGLPRGTTRGPKPSSIEPWSAMNYGPNLIGTYEVGTDGSNFAYKGIALRVDAGPGGVSRGRHWMVFDHDTLRVAAAWSGEGFVDWNGIQFNGRHEVHPRVVGQVHFKNETGPGWANPSHGGWADPRVRGRDGRPYGPLPRDWAHYKGMYQFDQHVILSYTVGDTAVLEMPGVADTSKSPVFTRTFQIGSRSRSMVLQVARHTGTDVRLRRTPSGDLSPTVVLLGGGPNAGIVAGLTIDISDCEWSATHDGRLLLRIAAGDNPLQFTLAIAQAQDDSDVESVRSLLASQSRETDLTLFTRGGPRRWPEPIKTQAAMGDASGPFAVDVLTHPVNNPWLCQLRLTGFDFFPDGDRVAVCSWDGDVWLVSGVAALGADKLSADAQRTSGRFDGRVEGVRGASLSWQRIASGLFQPLGLKVVDGRIFVTCRDQIAVLNDLNGDGETDYYENFNNDHQVTEHFHEFAMGLQRDAEGNFYYAKSARHALPALVPQHGTLLRVSRDGSRTDILATGFRAANGVCLNPDGSFVVTDQEGHWNPKNRINWVTPGGFYGNMFGYHDVTDSSDAAMQQPLCWITNSFDRSPAELLWVNSSAWGPLHGSLLNLSYGYGKVYVVPHETVDGQKQGGLCALPIPQFPTGIMRGRFHPIDGQLYLCGMFSWAGNQTQPGGFYRLRSTGKPVYLPIQLAARRTGMAVTFSGPLEHSIATEVRNYTVKTWSLKRTANYGSAHYDEKRSPIADARLSGDGKTVFLEMPNMQPTWCMEIQYTIRSADGQAVNGTIHNTVHRLGDPSR